MALNTERVWAELHANIRSFVGRRVRQPADVDDIVQRIFLQVHRALPSLRANDKLHAWIYQTARRAIVDYYRAPAQQREVPAGSALDLVPAETPVDASGTDNEASAQQELASCLRPLIGQLSAADQEALRLAEFEGITQVEAAGRLGLSVSGMKSRVQRARLRLREALENCCRVALDRRGGVLSYEGCAADSCGPSGPAAGPDTSAPDSGAQPCCRQSPRARSASFRPLVRL